MKDTLYWRIMAALFVTGLLYVGHGLHSPESVELPQLLPVASAGVGVANNESKILFTANEDGRKIYMWQYDRSKPPEFLGQAGAVLRRE